jgi:hypothetical protein
MAVAFVWITGLFLGLAEVRAQEKSVPAGKDYSQDPLQLLVDCRAAQQNVTGFTATFTKRERIKGELREQETMFVKCRYAPFSVYFKWLKSPKKDREAIYCEGKYENKVIGHQPPIPITAKLIPNSPDALKESLRPITLAGFRNVLDAIIGVTSQAKKAGDLRIFYIQDDTYNGRPAYCIIRKLPKKADYPYFLLYTYIDKEWMLPVRITAFDWDDNLVSSYTFSNVVLNAPLADADFDRDNRNYGYPADLFGKFLGGKKK